MGYWNGYNNFGEWAYFNNVTKKCLHCEESFTPNSANQTHCNYDQNSSCYSERTINELPLKKWITIHGQSVRDFIKENGIELYNSLKTPHNTTGLQ